MLEGFSSAALGEEVHQCQGVHGVGVRPLAHRPARARDDAAQRIGRRRVCGGAAAREGGRRAGRRAALPRRREDRQARRGGGWGRERAGELGQRISRSPVPAAAAEGRAQAENDEPVAPARPSGWHGRETPADRVGSLRADATKHEGGRGADGDRRGEDVRTWTDRTVYATRGGAGKESVSQPTAGLNAPPCRKTVTYRMAGSTPLETMWYKHSM